MKQVDNGASLYPTRTQAFLHFGTLIVRAPLLCTAAVFLFHPFYEYVIQRLGWSDASVFVLFAGVSHTASYILFNTFFMACDKYGWFKRFKLPRRPSQEPSTSLMWETVFKAAVSQLISPLTAYLAVTRLFSVAPQNTPLPSIAECTFHFAMATLCNEILFYTTHRLLHEFPFLYRNIHKQHHKYVGTVSIAAEYAHPLEDLAGAVIPTLGYLVAVRAPIPIIAVWLICRLYETYESHSGYCFRGTFLANLGLLNSDRAEFHDYHHTANVGNYGVNLFMDYLLGTMTPFLKSKQADAKRE